MMKRPETDVIQQVQRRTSLLFVWVFLGLGVGGALSGLIDYASGLATIWDQYLLTLTTFAYLGSAAILYWRRDQEWLAVVISLVPTTIYQVGTAYLAIHSPDPASYYSFASGGAFFAIVYVGLYIILTKGATLLSCLHCAGFFLLFLANNSFLDTPSPSPERLGAEHLLLSIMFSHPIYILALRYIVQLRERLFETQREAFENKAGFLAMLSHEIRNLLQTMVSTIDTLDLRLKEPSERRSVARLQTAAMQLQTYLSDVGELTKLENPALNVQTEPTNIAELLLDIREEWLPKAEARRLKLDVLFDEGLAPGFEIATDKARLRQIMVNLVSNALKYTLEGGVTIRASLPKSNTSSLSLEVVDSGIGIESKYLEGIFQPYVRLENPQLGRSEGSGLGLAIVLRLVRSIGGKISVESRVREGTAFRLDLP